jgi:hypothetical protein
MFRRIEMIYLQKITLQRATGTLESDDAFKAGLMACEDEKVIEAWFENRRHFQQSDRSGCGVDQKGGQPPGAEWQVLSSVLCVLGARRVRWPSCCPDRL